MNYTVVGLVKRGLAITRRIVSEEAGLLKALRIISDPDRKPRQTGVPPAMDALRVIGKRPRNVAGNDQPA
jgi:hypothetical protein